MGGVSSPALIAIVGPTGTGKSELSLNIAESLAAIGRAAEIVNADAMQLYRGMDIGTAKLPASDRRGIPHHLLDVLEVTDEATVAAYQAAARAAIEDVAGRGATPILVGGSGLYVSSVIFDFRFPATDRRVRDRLEGELAEDGVGRLYRRVKAVDPQAAASIGSSNARRLVRALEVIELTGLPYSTSLPEEPRAWMPVTVLGLRAPREELTARLDGRVESIWRRGLVAEVESLIPAGIAHGVTASRAIGYAQALGQIRGELTEPEAIALTQQLTRRYARRQMSWFKRYPGVTWLDYDSPDVLARTIAALG